ncbi:MAG: hypothetical protein V3W34_06135 [Phycisphaerae bacterium]
MAGIQNSKASNGDGGTAPPGDSAVEIAARRGFGPLSPLASEAWHGDSRPCVSCGQLVQRSAASCDACGEDLSDSMVQKMRAFAGPWYVLEHIRPFPGVTCERLIRQIRRGVLTRSTIIRGPTTDHQWRYAGETPGLSKYLGLCWNCQGAATPKQVKCDTCGVDLGELNDAPVSIPAATPSNPTDTINPAPTTVSPELQVLAEATRSAPRSDVLEEDAPRIGAVKVSWIIAAILIVVMAVLYAVVQIRDSAPSPERQRRVDNTNTLFPAVIRSLDG